MHEQHACSAGPAAAGRSTPIAPLPGKAVPKTTRTSRPDITPYPDPEPDPDEDPDEQLPRD